MTKKRNDWPLVVPPGTTHVGTARVREERAGMGYAQKKLAEKFGTMPNMAGFDDIADGVEPGTRPSLFLLAKKPAKYRNRKCEHDGIKFDSEKERSRWFHLIQLQAAGRIRDLRLQVAFVLTPRKRRDDGTWERASKYVADFVYVDGETGKQTVEDVKSDATRKNRTYIQKRKQMLAVHDITVKEI